MAGTPPADPLPLHTHRRSSFDTVRALIRHITHYITHWNQDSTPFVWTRQPADIIRKAVRR